MTRKALSIEDIERFRQAFCDKAFRLYQENDMHGVSMRAIAKEMGCSPMTAYRYFDNKEHVFGYLRGLLFDQLAEVLESVDDKLGPRLYLQELAHAYTRFALNEPHAYRILYLVHLTQSSASIDVERAQNRTKKVLFNATLNLIESGQMSGDPVVIAHSLWGLIHGLVSLHLTGNLNQGASLDDLLPGILAMFEKRMVNINNT